VTIIRSTLIIRDICRDKGENYGHQVLPLVVNELKKKSMNLMAMDLMLEAINWCIQWGIVGPYSGKYIWIQIKI
jgi:hypothetical protein